MVKTFRFKALNGYVECLLRTATKARESGDVLYVSLCACCGETYARLEFEKYLEAHALEFDLEEYRASPSTMQWAIRKLGIHDVCRVISDKNFWYIRNNPEAEIFLYQEGTVHPISYK